RRNTPPALAGRPGARGRALRRGRSLALSPEPDRRLAGGRERRTGRRSDRRCASRAPPDRVRSPLAWPPELPTAAPHAQDARRMREMTVQDLAERLANGEKPFLLDVRQKWEHDLARLPGSTLVPL